MFGRNDNIIHQLNLREKSFHLCFSHASTALFAVAFHCFSSAINDAGSSYAPEARQRVLFLKPFFNDLMTLRHSRDPSLRRSSFPPDSRNASNPPPFILDPAYPNDAYPPIPQKKKFSPKRGWIGSKATILRLVSFDITDRKRGASHEKVSHRLDRTARKHRTAGGVEPVQGDHIRWGRNAVRNKPRDERLQTGGGGNPQYDSRPQLARTGLAEDKLQLQRRRNRSQQHRWQQWWRRCVQHRRLLRRRRMPSSSKPSTTCRCSRC